jgi:MarR-like DNA-binding transcriptional regulator SgrR of sgrS sRNA
LLGLPAVKTGGGSVEELYAAEEGVLATERVIPLLHLPATYAASPRVRNWRVRADGGLELANAWLETP